ncbi:hypothetical protein ABUK73_20050 [Agrobacterium sp. BA1120]|uniref:hypothetical protein n=1 Tax=Agrobacterium sp. BA1120 TaxID=3228927 RepID=UPI00336AE5F9
MISISVAKEAFPEIGGVSNPAVLCNGEEAFVCYKVSHREGRGNALLKFSDVIDFRLTPLNTERLDSFRYLISPWQFNEVFGGDQVARWKAFDPRFWLISFNDVVIEILFGTVCMILRDEENFSPQKTLLSALIEEQV